MQRHFCLLRSIVRHDAGDPHSHHCEVQRSTDRISSMTFAMVQSTHGVHYGAALGRENAARAAARRCAERSKAPQQKAPPVRRASSYEDPVAAARRRISEYTRKQSVRPETRVRSVSSWYNSNVAQRLVRARRRKASKTDSGRIAANLRHLEDTVTAMLRGRFGTFTRGSFVLLAERPATPAAKWRPARSWVPGPYCNALVLSNLRTFGPPPRLVPRAFRFAVRAFQSKIQTRSSNPRWQLVASALRRHLLNHPAVLLQRRAQFRAQVALTREAYPQF